MDTSDSLKGNITLMGDERVVPAAGGEMLKNEIGEYTIGGRHEPAGFRLLDDSFIDIGCIEEIRITN